MRVACVEWKVS